MALDDHPQRYAMANELHARPFPSVSAPARAVYLAVKPAENAAGRDREADRAHLIDLLDRFGAKHPPPGATHYFGDIGKYRLKWESHTEFVTFTILADGLAERPFDAETWRVFPTDWLDAAPGRRLTSALIRVEVAEGDEGIAEKVNGWFVPESLAISRVLDDQLVVAGDFRIDEAGHMRFAVFARPGTGARRTGRVVQRLCEIETYKAMSMMGLFMARELGGRLNDIETQLGALMADMTGNGSEPAETLQSLLAISAELEKVAAQSSFRFGATGAYETIVDQRINVLREARFGGRQTFGEFMMRRYEPAMRTVKSTEKRLQAMSDRALRAGDLLRTRVDVERSAQNQKLLESMDRRSDTQLQLQKTVEGLSVVAISYYGVNIALYLLGPAFATAGLSSTVGAALVTGPIILGVWWMVRRIHKSME